MATFGKKKIEAENNREGEKWSGEKKMLGYNTFFFNQVLSLYTHTSVLLSLYSDIRTAGKEFCGTWRLF